ncbi:MAG: helix-turn-helix transcriptional regulator [Gammaproteobacteria bacterium]|nr:helix-turn-helix transcriptional regulator [Gammaproteobacteria bacterium]
MPHSNLHNDLHSNDFDEQLDRYRQELRRGAIVLAVLAQLRKEHYGYSLRKSLASRGLPIDEGTLYPLIRRLEKQGLLDSEWRMEANRKKRFYQLNATGKRLLRALAKEWQAMNENINQILA